MPMLGINCNNLLSDIHIFEAWSWCVIVNWTNRSASVAFCDLTFFWRCWLGTLAQLYLKKWWWPMASPGFGVSVRRGTRRSRREHRGAKGAEWGEVRGVSAPQPTTGVWGNIVSSPAPLSHFLHILGHRTLLVARKIRFSCPKYKEKLVLQYCET